MNYNKDSCSARFLLLQSRDISATTAGHQLHRTHNYIPTVPLVCLRTRLFLSHPEVNISFATAWAKVTSPQICPYLFRATSSWPCFTGRHASPPLRPSQQHWTSTGAQASWKRGHDHHAATPGSNPGGTAHCLPESSSTWLSWMLSPCRCVLNGSSILCPAYSILIENQHSPPVPGTNKTEKVEDSDSIIVPVFLCNRKTVTVAKWEGLGKL